MGDPIDSPLVCMRQLGCGQKPIGNQSDVCMVSETNPKREGSGTDQTASARHAASRGELRIEDGPPIGV